MCIRDACSLPPRSRAFSSSMYVSVRIRVDNMYVDIERFSVSLKKKSLKCLRLLFLTVSYRLESAVIIHGTGGTLIDV